MRRVCTQSISFRAATTADIEWLVELRIETMGEHLRASGEDVVPDVQRARVIQDFECIRIVTEGVQSIGMVKVVKESSRWRLFQIQLIPERQGEGIGGGIVGELLDEARRQKISVVLSVLKVNPARRLYERLGFKIVAEKGRAYEMRADPHQ